MLVSPPPPPPGSRDDFCFLRSRLVNFFKQVRAPLRLTKQVQEKGEAPVFSDEELQHMREFLQEWFCESVGRVQLDWSVPPGQPFALHVLSKHVGDKDASLRPGGFLAQLMEIYLDRRLFILRPLGTPRRRIS